MWALGVVLYIIISGYPPFRAKDLKQLTKKIINYPVNFSGPEWQNVSKSCKQLIRRMLSKKPTERITVQDALSHEWITKFTNNLDKLEAS